MIQYVPVKWKNASIPWIFRQTAKIFNFWKVKKWNKNCDLFVIIKAGKTSIDFLIMSNESETTEINKI